jgi:hypothetical protein
MITRLVRIAVRWPIQVLAAWGAFVLVLTAIGLPNVQSRLLPATLFIPGTDSFAWHELKKPNYGEALALAIKGPPAVLDQVGPKLNTDLNLRSRTRAQSPWSPGAGSAASAAASRPDLAVYALLSLIHI